LENEREEEYQHIMMNMAMAEADMGDDKDFSDLVLELKDDPDDMFLLLRTLAMALTEEPDPDDENYEQLYEIVNKVLKYALKKEKIDGEDLGMVHMYLHKYPSETSTV